MKTTRLVLILAAISGNYQSVFASCLTLTESVYIHHFNAIRILPSPHRIEVVLTLQNRGGRLIHAQNAQFLVVVNPEGSPAKPPDHPQAVSRLINQLGDDPSVKPEGRLELGTTTPVDIRLPKGEDVPLLLTIHLPRKKQKRMNTIYRFINYLGLPGSKKRFGLEGSMTVIDPPGAGDIRVNWRDKPRLESRVLYWW